MKKTETPAANSDHSAEHSVDHSVDHRTDHDGKAGSRDGGAHSEVLFNTGALQHAILDNATFALIATDEKGIIQLFNAGAEQLLGYAAADVVNKLSPHDLHDPEEVIARAAALSEEFATAIKPGFGAMTFKASLGIEDTYELTYIRKDGSRFPAVVSITALKDITGIEDKPGIKDKPGTIIGYLLIGTNNSVRKQAELALASAGAVVKRASLGKSDFLVQLSHELRTPLNVILGFAELMATGVPPLAPTQEQNIAEILVAGRYLLELSNKILDLALIEAGRVTISVEPVSLADVLRECRVMVAPQATARRVHMAFPQFDTPCFVCADRTRLKQVLDNLLLNAIRHNNAGGAVDIECTLDAKTPGTIRVSVKDTGTGLAPERLQQLFQPVNGHGQEARTEAGVGLGLVIAKQLIEMMGGNIGANSVVGNGSTFWIELETTTAIKLAMPIEEPATIVPPLAANGTPLRTLLYVEDNPANLELVKQLIARRPDLRLLSAPDGVSGIESARVNQPEVILMDINLPGINGVEAMKILSTLPSTAHIPVVALSANVMPADISKGLKSGFYLYLTKPIKFDLFMEALDKALEHSQTNTQLDSVAGTTPH